MLMLRAFVIAVLVSGLTSQISSAQCIGCMVQALQSAQNSRSPANPFESGRMNIAAILHQVAPQQKLANKGHGLDDPRRLLKIDYSQANGVKWNFPPETWFPKGPIASSVETMKSSP